MTALTSLLTVHFTRLLVTALLVLAMRHHLFVWSVFAPKFAYEVAWCVFAVLVYAPVLVWPRLADSGADAGTCSGATPSAVSAADAADIASDNVKKTE